MPLNLKYTYLELPESFYSLQSPEPVQEPKLLCFNQQLAEDLGITDEWQNPEIVKVFAGNAADERMNPFSQAYAGHQFGNFNILGDGRAVVMGEHQDSRGRLWDLQLKGSGPTPYSRRGDGRAALGPMLREWIISEAMHALAIPTTRTLAVISTGQDVYRQECLPGALMIRVAASHLRVGTFEFARTLKDPSALKSLADYSIRRHDPHLVADENPYLSFLKSVSDRQADTVTSWLGVGFIHGVMNTDNMAISGETIDYGPCAFMDVYDPKTVFSSIDHQGRYAYQNQGRIAQWNLARLAETLLPLLDAEQNRAIEMATEVIGQFPADFEQAWLQKFARKIGITKPRPQDAELISELTQVMYQHQLDFTNTFASLGAFVEHAIPAEGPSAALKSWVEKWRSRVLQEGDVQKIQTTLNECNPVVIPRNYLVEEALKEATIHQNLSRCEELWEVLKTPFDQKYQNSKFAQGPNEQQRVYQTFCGT